MKIMKSVLAAVLIGSTLTSVTAAANAPKDFSQVNKPATIKILLAKQKDDVLLEVKGRYQIFNPDDETIIDTGIFGKRSKITSTENNIQWADLLPFGLRQFRIVPGDSQTAILVDGIQYYGCVEAYDHNGKITVVNEVDVENYLKSILSPQFSTEKSTELLDAIAITARTNTYYTIANNNYALWHVDAAEVGYQGLGLAFQNPKLDRSIDATRHMVMTYKKSPFVALWTKDSAGKTAGPTAILRKEVNAPQGVQSPIAQHDREKRNWSLTVTKEQLAKIAGVKNVNAVDLFLDQTSGKVYAIRVHDGFFTKDVDFFTLQKALGAHKLRSSDFTLNLKKENILISGFGEGHGVGLCLYSARIMADHGEKAPKILSTFFPQTELEKKREIK